jgi:hypothetical protein
MARFGTFYDPVIHDFDAIGWIPTIRGALSLNFLDNSISPLGDVDKFSIEIQTYNGFSSSRYLAASSLFVFDDSKKGWHYLRTFRFIFRGTINDEERQNTFIEATFDENQRALAKKLFAKKGKDLLIGRLSMMAIPNKLTKRKLTDKEKEILSSMKNLKEMKEKYDKAYKLDAETLSALEEKRKGLKEQWIEVEKNTLAIEKDTGDNPIYMFDVILSRDGILFLKDVTCVKFKETYFTPDKPDDYTKNIPLHRVFKVALHFMTSLFHKNYHHSLEDDAFLPATNLHPIKADKTLERLVKHQIEAFLNPAIRAKRDIYTSKKYISCNPEGIFPYLESFLYILENNMFIKSDDAELLRKFIDTQSKEYKVWSSDKKVRRNSFLTQRNLVARLTVSLAVLVAGINAFNFIEPCYLTTLHRVWIIFILGGIGWIIHTIVIQKHIYGGIIFKPKKQRNKFWNKDSHVADGKLSPRYAFRLSWTNTKLYIKRENASKVVILWWIFLILLALYISYVIGNAIFSL